MKNNLLLQKVFFSDIKHPKTIEISPLQWLLSLSKRSVYYVVVQWSQLTDHIVSLLLMTTNPRCEKRSVSKEFKILRAFFKEFIKIFSPSLSNKFPWAFCKTFNILVSSRNCFSGELSCTSSKLGKIQAFCWDSNLRYVLNVRQMPYCHVNFFSGITYFISVAMTLKTVLPNFFFLKMWIELVCT